jgi:hypothetical protein
VAGERSGESSLGMSSSDQRDNADPWNIEGGDGEEAAIKA